MRVMDCGIVCRALGRVSWCAVVVRTRLLVLHRRTVGTLFYVAPEILTDGYADQASDMWR